MAVQILWPEVTEVTPLSPDEARVFAVPVDEVDASEDELLATLSAEEREHAERFQSDRARRQFVAGRAALRMLLGRLFVLPAANVELTIDAHGKPRVSGPGGSTLPKFNLAHSEDMVLVAVAFGCEVGVDVERVRAVSRWEQMARRYFHAGEVEEIFAAPPAERDAAFLRCWTGKEAVVKAIGGGLSESLAAFHVPVKNHHGTWVEIPRAVAGSAVRCWLQPLLPNSDYVGAVACVGEKRRVSFFTLRP